jgi:hypothetical protein
MSTEDDDKATDGTEDPLEALFRSMQAARQSYKKDTLNSRPFQDGLPNWRFHKGKFAGRMSR